MISREFNASRHHRSNFFIRTAFLFGVTLLLGIGKPVPTAASAQGNTGLVLAFYYAWYSPASFGPNLTPYQPISPYFSTDEGVIRRHVDEAKAAGIDAFVQSWYGPSANQTQTNFQTLLSVASTRDFKAAIDFETGGPFFSSNEERISALTSLLATHAQHPAYLRVDGKPVIFFWANWMLSVEDWRLIRDVVDPGSGSIWIAEGGNPGYLSVFDGLHLYNIAWSPSPGGVLATWANRTRSAAAEHGVYKYWVATAMPGFDDSLLGKGDDSVTRARNNGSYFQTSFAGAAATSPDMIIITSFNEWKEGSNIEPSLEFGRFYLDLSAQLSATFKMGGVPSAPVTERSAQATSEPADDPIETSPTSQVTVTPDPTPFIQPTPNSNGSIIYSVQPGDTLTLIANRFRIPVEQILRLNQIDEESILSIGQELLIQATDAIQEPKIVTTFPETTIEPDGKITYEVKEDDTLIQIALEHNLSLDEILALNPDVTQDSLLRIGQKITVGFDMRPEEIGGSTDAAPPTSTAILPRLSPTDTPVLESSPATLIPETSLATPTDTFISPIKSEVTRQAPQLDDQDGFFVSPQQFMILVAVLAILGGGFLYLGRRG